MVLHDLKWSPSEKKIARRAFDAALETALAKVLAEFKRRANATSTPSEMWEIEDFLRQQRREIDESFDYRYSQMSLPVSFERGIWTRASLLACRKRSARSFAHSLLSLRKGDGGRPGSTSRLDAMSAAARPRTAAPASP